MPNEVLHENVIFMFVGFVAVHFSRVGRYGRSGRLASGHRGNTISGHAGN
jgi:hypothetical protein